jgi:hypothetical protein
MTKQEMLAMSTKDRDRLKVLHEGGGNGGEEMGRKWCQERVKKFVLSVAELKWWSDNDVTLVAWEPPGGGCCL